MTLNAPRSTGLGRGIGFGLVAALVGAAAWAGLTVLTDYKLGLVAIGIGFLVGFAMQRSGSTDSRLPIAGAVVALLGCFLGDVVNDAHGLSVAFKEVTGQSVSTLTVLRSMLEDPRYFADVYKAGFRAMDLAFYAIAAYEGYKFARLGVEKAKADLTPPPAYSAPLSPSADPGAAPSAGGWSTPAAEPAEQVPGDSQPDRT